MRYIVFTAGCPLRCKFCHNPDTWKMDEGKKMSPAGLLQDAVKDRSVVSRADVVDPENLTVIRARIMVIDLLIPG